MRAKAYNWYIGLKDALFGASLEWERPIRCELAHALLKALPETRTERELVRGLFGW